MADKIWTDPISGVQHSWPGITWRCSIHKKECSPITPITGASLLKRAANDPTVSDDVFAVLAPAIEGRPIFDDTNPTT